MIRLLLVLIQDRVILFSLILLSRNFVFRLVRNVTLRVMHHNSVLTKCEVALDFSVSITVLGFK